MGESDEAYSNYEFLELSPLKNENNNENDVVASILKTKCSSILQSLSIDNVKVNTKLTSLKKPIRHTMTIMDKYKIIELREKGLTVSKIVKETGIPRNTVYGILRKKEVINKEVMKTKQIVNNTLLNKRKRVKKVTHPELEDALHLWFTNKRENNIPISDLMMRQQAMIFHRSFCTQSDCSFVASTGWFQKFKIRRGLRILQITGEKLSANEPPVLPYKQNDLIPTLVNKHYSLNRIFNADETGLYFKLLGNNTLVGSTEKSAPGRKVLKDRITFMPCTNADGSFKLKLQVIGKSQNPRCFKTDGYPLDVSYTATPKSWQTNFSFWSWVHHCFAPEVSMFCIDNDLPLDVLLIIDNCSAHRTETFDIKVGDIQIKIEFLPPNVTSLCQPMDMGLISTTKSK